MRRRQRALAMIRIYRGRPLVIVVMRVRHSRAVRRCLSLIRSVGVAGGRAVAVLVTMVTVVTAMAVVTEMAPVTWRRVHGMSRSVLVGVKGGTVAAVNRDWWWRRGVIGIFIVVIQDIGNSWQSNSTSLDHLCQGALGQAAVGPSEVGRVKWRVAWAILGIAVDDRGSNDRFRRADGSIAGLNGLDIGVRCDCPALIRA